MTRSALVALALTALLGMGAAAAQSYQIRQAGSMLGSFRVALTRAPGGTVSDSRLSLTGLADLSDHLVTDAAGDARSYHLEGTARGTPLTMDVVLSGAQASFTIEQGGAKQSLQVPLPGPVLILDNSMLDGWQILADRLDPGAAQPQRFDVLVPQAARTGTVSVRAAGKGSVEVGGASQSAERFDVTLNVAGQSVDLVLWLDGTGRIVAFEQPLTSLRYELETPASSAAAASAAAAARAATAALQRHLSDERACLREHVVQVHSGGETLAGTLSVPVASQAGVGAPALLLIPGSGAVDRDGNAPPLITNGMYRQFAYALACQGYAVLRIDKLGIGASSGDGNAVTLATYARNVADWVALLRARPDIDPRRVGLVGHSEGGLVALYAVANGYVDPATVVLLESPGLPLGQVIIAQLARLARLRGASASQVAAVEAQARQAVEAIRASSGTRMELTGALADNPVAAAFAHAAGLLRSEIDEDPALLASRVRAPVLVVQGGKDVQVPPRNGEALAHAAPHATYLYLPDLEHDLYEVSGDAIDHASPGPGTLLSTTLFDALHSYLAGHLLVAP
jgi:hypothetical protein